MSEQDDISTQMDGVLHLMTQRASGRVNNQQVESAVDKVLLSMGAVPPAVRKNSTGINREEPREPVVKADTGNYDDGEEDDGDASSDPDHKESSAHAVPAAPRSSKKRLKYTKEEYRELMQDIPMGKVGSEMMTSFGDGPQPDIEALKLALKGTRDALQLVVMDARAVRRKAMANYLHAQEQALSGFKKRKKLDTQKAVDPSLVYRAMLSEKDNVHDPLGKNRPCGFDVEELQTLYPEEFRAYQRWTELHGEYEELATKKADLKEEEESKQKQSSEVEENPLEENEDHEEYLGGHLLERAATFDARTDDMGKDQYLKFSRIRQGSFLPRRSKRSRLEVEWESLESGGRGKEGSWMRMSAVSVRFLHWLGFDPPEKPPPNAETTQLLGFLGYDRIGRIVEKAVYLRNAKRTNDDVNPTDLSLRKLPDGDQLSKEDIEAALKDPDVKPESLFRLDSKSQNLPNAQLYFGPGFEQRLELELEE